MSIPVYSQDGSLRISSRINEDNWCIISPTDITINSTGATGYSIIQSVTIHKYINEVSSQPIYNSPFIVNNGSTGPTGFSAPTPVFDTSSPDGFAGWTYDIASGYNTPSGISGDILIVLPLKKGTKFKDFTGAYVKYYSYLGSNNAFSLCVHSEEFWNKFNEYSCNLSSGVSGQYISSTFNGKYTILYDTETFNLLDPIRSDIQATDLIEYVSFKTNTNYLNISTHIVLKSITCVFKTYSVEHHFT